MRGNSPCHPNVEVAIQGGVNEWLEGGIAAPVFGEFSLSTGRTR